MIGCYCRVSTEDQSLDRQREKTAEYATDNFDVEAQGLQFYMDTSTGTDIARDGYHEMLEDVKGGEVSIVITSSVSRLSRSIRDLSDTVDVVIDNGAELHIIDESFQLTGDDDPYQQAMLKMLGVFAELEAEITQQRVREGIRVRMENEDYHHGPAPLGFEKDDGHLLEGPNYDRVRAVLDEVERGNLSKRKAAHELDTSRRTINRALDRAELYNLDG